jgi:hypothetical protein
MLQNNNIMDKNTENYGIFNYDSRGNCYYYEKSDFKCFDENLILNLCEKCSGRVFYVDKNLKNIIYVQHSGGDGGTFLSNCLTLSSNLYFTKNEFMDRIKFLFENLKLINSEWEDVTLYRPNFNNKLDRNFHGVIKVHHLKDVIGAINFWKHVKIIVFKNTELFILMRNSNHVMKYCDYRNFDSLYEKISSEYMKYLKEINFNEISEEIIEKMKLVIPTDDDLYKQEMYSNPFFYWDVNWFFSKKETLYNIEKLCSLLGLTNYNEKLISKYYEEWIYKVNKISKL